jgi:thioesterase domain-containing protein
MAAAAQLEQLMAHPVSPAWIFQAPTPRELALLLEVTLTAPASHIVALQPQGARAPLFCLHDLFSRPLTYANLARILSPDQPVYGLVPGPLEAAIIADPRLDVLTPAYVNAIRNIQRHGPYRIVGYSFGGVPAFDVAQALLAENEDVLLIMIDPYIFGGTPSLTETAKWVARRGRMALKDVWAAEQLPFPRIAGTARWTTRQTKRAIRQVRKGLTRRRMPREAIAASKVPVWVSPAGWPLAKSLLEAEAVYRYRPYWGSALFIQVNDRNTLLDFLNADGLNGWAGLFKGTLDRIEVPARHDWILRHPAVAEVAKVIRAL